MTFASSRRIWIWALAGAAVSALLFFGVRSVVAAGDGPNDPGGVGTASANCFSAHNAGAGAEAFNVCFSDHGNMTKWESPAGIEFIQLGVIREGYSICASGLTYSDYGQEENLTDGAFGPPTIQQPGGPGTFPLTIIRVTTDGRVRNAMTFTKDNNEKDVNIKHKVTNLTSSSLTNVRVTRMFDGDRSRFVGGPGEFWRRTADSVWNLGAPDDGTDHGLLLEPRSISFSQNPDSAVTTFGGADGCSPVSEPTPVGGGGADYEGHLTTSLATLGAGVSKQALYRYGRM